MKVKVKICGIRNIKAAKVAVDAGADFLGFNFVPSSKRYLTPFDAAKIINMVKGQVKIVGVFQNAEIISVNKIASDVNLDFVQLHGMENNKYIAQVNIFVIKSITINDQPAKIKADYFLLDRSGRTGVLVDFKKAAKLARQYNLFLAGGLNPDNVADAVEKIQPFAVDVASGIETDNKQDLEKIKLFIQNAKGVIL